MTLSGHPVMPGPEAVLSPQAQAMGVQPVLQPAGTPQGMPTMAGGAHIPAHGAQPAFAQPGLSVPATIEANLPGQQPQFTLPPPDTALALRITKLAEYTARNGAAFEAQVRAKQSHNPEYAFLHGGDGGAYYQWCLHCYANGIPVDRAPPDAAVAPAPDTAFQPHQEPQQAWVPQQAPHAPAAAFQQPFMPPTATMGQPPAAQIPVAAPAAAPAAAPLAAPPHGAEPMPPDVASGFAQVLHVLQGSQESIKASSAWFLACRTHAAGMADMMVHRVQQLPDFQAQLHVIYLMNDLFFAAAAEGPAAAGQMQAVFKSLIPVFFATAYRTAACSQEAFGQLCSLLDLWSARNVVDVATSATARARMLDAGAPAAVPIPVHAQQQFMPAPPQRQQHAPQPFPQGGPPAQGWHPPDTQQQPPSVGMHGQLAPAPFPAARRMGQPANEGPPGPPGQWSGPGGPPGGPTRPMGMGHHGAAPAPGPDLMGAPAAHPPASGFPRPPAAPEKDPYDLLSFPAGLIPKLVRRHLTCEREYTPLRQEDIDSEPPPPRPVNDSYLQGRLQRLYAEIAQFQPGVHRAAYEEKLATLGDGLLPPAPEPAAKSAHLAISRETNMRSDGSYAGPDVGRGGLGVHDSGSGDLYDDYRRQRSGRYHSIMATKSTNPNRPPHGH